MKEVNDNNRCFVCGGENPVGLRLQFDNDDGGTRTTLLFPEHFQGWESYVHGGILSTVLDEIMVRAAMAKGTRCVTGEITVKFLKPVLTSTPYTLIGRLVEERGRVLLAEAWIEDAGRQVMTRATGKLVVLTTKTRRHEEKLK